MQATINGNTYHIEFSYRRSSHRQAPGNLAPSSTIKGVVSCAIVKMPTSTHQSPLISVASVVCSPADNWSRRSGRWYAFDRAVESCGILRKQTLEFNAWFDKRFPNPALQQSVPRKKLSPEEKSALMSAGRLTRWARGSAKSTA